MEDLTKENRLHVGVLAIIGSFLEHVNLTTRAVKTLKELPSHPLKNTEVEITTIRRPDQVTDSLDALIIPGGETTVLCRFLEINNFACVLKSWTQKPNKLTWGTCAGLIILSNKIESDGKSPAVVIGGLDITCVRNGYGRQRESHVVELEFANDELRDATNLGSNTSASNKFPAIFIRAPVIKSVDSDDVKVLCLRKEVMPFGERVPQSKSPQPVGVAQGNKMATTFHPELTDDIRWHAFFLSQALKRKSIY